MKILMHTQPNSNLTVNPIVTWDTTRGTTTTRKRFSFSIVNEISFAAISTKINLNFPLHNFIFFLQLHFSSARFVLFLRVDCRGDKNRGEESEGQKENVKAKKTLQIFQIFFNIFRFLKLIINIPTDSALELFKRRD